jgi:hypothetical protein
MRPSKTLVAASAVTPSSRPATPSSTDTPVTPRVALPTDLSTSLRYLDDAQLQRLSGAVAAEINRRDQRVSPTSPSKAAGTEVSQSASLRQEANVVEGVPEGKVNVIRAAFNAGVKPAAIARAFRVSQSLVNRVIRAAANPKR